MQFQERPHKMKGEEIQSLDLNKVPKKVETTDLMKVYYKLKNQKGSQQGKNRSVETD